MVAEGLTLHSKSQQGYIKQPKTQRAMLQLGGLVWLFSTICFVRVQADEAPANLVAMLVAFANETLILSANPEHKIFTLPSSNLIPNWLESDSNFISFISSVNRVPSITGGMPSTGK